MKSRNIYTIGYESCDIGGFADTLRSAKIQYIIDIRQVPISRKRGFSKKVLKEFLEGLGFSYIHLRDLGDPKAGREAARRKDFAQFEHIFRTHLAGVPAQEAILKALQIAESSASCLLCYERDYRHCHRCMVADELASRSSLQIEHLTVPEKIEFKHPINGDGNRSESLTLRA